MKNNKKLPVTMTDINTTFDYFYSKLLIKTLRIAMISHNEVKLFFVLKILKRLCVLFFKYKSNESH